MDVLSGLDTTLMSWVQTVSRPILFILGVLSLYMYRCKAAIVNVSRIKNYNKLIR